jgi:hypothetical protein
MVRVILALALTLAFCGEDATGTPGDGGAHDAGPARVWEDAGIDSGTLGIPDGGASPAFGEFDSEGPDSNPDRAADVACLNGVDDNADGITDCEDPACQAEVPFCCIGVGSTACCVPGTPAPLALSQCSGPVDGCSAILAQASVFGAPYVATIGGDTSASFVPGGVENDAGLLFPEVDTRASAVHLSATIAASSEPHELGADMLAFGLTDAASAAGLLRVAPAVAFFVSGNRSDLSLMLAGEVVGRWPLDDSEPHTYGLIVRPGGAIELSRDGSVIATATLPIDRPLRPALYGRSFNPGASDPAPARASAAAISVEVCDMPAALVRPSAPLAISSGALWDATARVAGPSVERWTDGDGAHDTMALEVDGTIYLATRQGDAYVLASALGAPELYGEEEWAEERLADPVLRWTGSALELWFTAEANGITSVARARAAAGTQSFAWADVERVYAGTGDVSYSSPAPLDIAGTPHVIMRARRSAGEALELYQVGSSAAPIPLRAPSPNDLFAFDRDELDAPSLLQVGATYRLYFAGRRGSRWSIGMLVSPDGLRWSEPDGGALVYGGGESGFDALGVRDPEAVVDGERLYLYYAGTDGVRTRIGAAIGAAPPR